MVLFAIQGLFALSETLIKGKNGAQNHLALDMERTKYDNRMQWFHPPCPAYFVGETPV